MKNGKIILITILQPHAPSLFQYLQIGLDLVYMTHKSNFYPNSYTSISTYQKKKKMSTNQLQWQYGRIIGKKNTNINNNDNNNKWSINILCFGIWAFVAFVYTEDMIKKYRNHHFFFLFLLKSW